MQERNAENRKSYDVIVTVEDFCEGEVKAVDEETARMTGELLAKMHNISEQEKLHLNMRTMLDPLLTEKIFLICRCSRKTKTSSEV